MKQTLPSRLKYVECGQGQAEEKCAEGCDGSGSLSVNHYLRHTRWYCLAKKNNLKIKKYVFSAKNCPNLNGSVSSDNDCEEYFLPDETENRTRFLFNL